MATTAFDAKGGTLSCRRVNSFSSSIGTRSGRVERSCPSLMKEGPSSSKASRTLTDLDTEKSRISTILHSLPDGVVVTNTAGRVVLINPAARQMLGLAQNTGPGAAIAEYVPDQGLCTLIQDISKGRFIDYEDIPIHEFTTNDERFLLARGQPVLGERRECLGAVINLSDVTAMKVIDRLKSEFVAKVSHELRSPLATIHEQLAKVMRDMMDVASESDRYILARAKEKTHGLISMIGDLLDLSRIEEGLICRESEPVQVETLVGNVVAFLKTRAEGKGQTINMLPPDQALPPINADPVALESIFGNLIANAINYTPDGGTIRVAVDQAGINLRVKVSDTGFGIEEKYLSKIFDRFYRVKNDKTRLITGTGLGLPIVKQLVDSLGGFIDVESTPGSGSTFTVLLPVSGQGAAA